ncbi:putative ribonuclease T2 [Rosellinia necatrix]|uniref:Putative ribonuclease T2 n=1 Tax=Rosellinia necatrix TaxID=77044 RepID=A0A1S7UJZ5_ROSNE|nr:putative ribonuclease T2 [Rosellinia necatrix]
MPQPLPVPSKGALLALRSLALGTSCAIGIIVEDRRRRISTLQTAVANLETLKSSRHYCHGRLEQSARSLHGSAAAAAIAAAVVEHAPRWREMEGDEMGKHRSAEATDHTSSDAEASEGHEAQVVPQGGDNLHARHTPQLLPQSSPKPLPKPPPHPPPHPPPQPPPQLTAGRYVVSPRPISSIQASLVTPSEDAIAIREANHYEFLQQSYDTLIVSMQHILDSTAEAKLGRAILLFNSNSLALPPAGLQRERWLDQTVRLTRECQANGRWEDASHILTTVIGYGPLDEARYFSYHPYSIIEFHLRRPGSNTLCSKESVIMAAKLFLADLKDKHSPRGVHMERVGKALMLEAFLLQFFNLSHKVYWRTIGWAEDSERFVRWAIQLFFRHNDHKNVVNRFLIHYSRLKAPSQEFNQTMDAVMESIRATKGSGASSILEAFARMECPEDTKLRTRWVMRVLQSYWIGHEDVAGTQALFQKAISLGLLDKVFYPQSLYRCMVEIAVKAGDEEMAHMYADKVIHDHPDMKAEIALILAVLEAKEGDWDAVLEAFQRVRPGELAGPAAYTDAFLLILKIFADSHTAVETRNFVMLYTRHTDVEFHPFMVTLVAKKYSEARDLEGFLAWLEFSSAEGFALDSGFCNVVLHSCSTTWKMSFPELRRVHSRLMVLNPHFSDEVTQRILSQSANREIRPFNRCRPKVIAVSRLAYTGRSTNNREIYEAMHQELLDKKPRSAVAIYKRAMHSGMAFCSHCHRLVVLATLQGKDLSLSSEDALALIRDAHAEGHDVGHAVSTFIKCQIDAFSGSNEDMIVHMRNLISRFESAQIVIPPSLLTHMATVCVKVEQPEKAIALCILARDRSGASHLCFSKKSFKALATAYWQLFDVGGMDSLINDMCQSEFSTDKTLISHLKSIGRLVRKINPTNTRGARGALMDVVERGIQQMTQERAEARRQGKLIAQETLRIVGDAVADLQKSKLGHGMSERRTTAA